MTAPVESVTVPKTVPSWVCACAELVYRTSNRANGTPHLYEHCLGEALKLASITATVLLQPPGIPHSFQHKPDTLVTRVLNSIVPIVTRELRRACFLAVSQNSLNASWQYFDRVSRSFSPSLLTMWPSFFA